MKLIPRSIGGSTFERCASLPRGQSLLTGGFDSLPVTTTCLKLLVSNVFGHRRRLYLLYDSDPVPFCDKGIATLRANTAYDS